MRDKKPKVKHRTVKMDGHSSEPFRQSAKKPAPDAKPRSSTPIKTATSKRTKRLTGIHI